MFVKNLLNTVNELNEKEGAYNRGHMTHIVKGEDASIDRLFDEANQLPAGSKLHRVYCNYISGEENENYYPQVAVLPDGTIAVTHCDEWSFGQAAEQVAEFILSNQHTEQEFIADCCSFDEIDHDILAA